jgi:hypothetical protein
LINCGVQLINFDGDVIKSLDSLADELTKVSKTLKEYFSRCNEINYFVDKDSDDGKRFELQATAYSGIGFGGHFCIDIGKGTVEVVKEERGNDDNDDDSRSSSNQPKGNKQPKGDGDDKDNGGDYHAGSGDEDEDDDEDSTNENDVSMLYVISNTEIIGLWHILTLFHATNS